jgi:hypothetical protein
LLPGPASLRRPLSKRARSCRCSGRSCTRTTRRWSGGMRGALVRVPMLRRRPLAGRHDVRDLDCSWLVRVGQCPDRRVRQLSQPQASPRASGPGLRGGACSDPPHRNPLLSLGADGAAASAGEVPDGGGDPRSGSRAKPILGATAADRSHRRVCLAASGLAPGRSDGARSTSRCAPAWIGRRCGGGAQSCASSTAERGSRATAAGVGSIGTS